MAVGGDSDEDDGTADVDVVDVGIGAAGTMTAAWPPYSPVEVFNNLRSNSIAPLL